MVGEEVPSPEILTPREQEIVNESSVAPTESVTLEQSESAPTPTPSVTTPEPSTPALDTPVMYTKAEVALHKDATSCWTIINNVVYDLTTWVSKHPGGDRAILKICGRDGTSLFEGKHGGDAKPESALQTFKLGNLSE
jgi:cytochrome b involved in lipid metabolism